MCHDEAVHPTHSTDEQMVLTSADGSTFAAYLARAEQPNGAAMVYLPDVNGLGTVAKELAHRFARTGADVLVIDYYGRTAGTEPRDGIDKDKHTPFVNRANVVADVRAAVEHLRSEIQRGRTYLIGSCFGGAMALYCATTDIGAAGAIAFCPWTGAIGESDALPDSFVADAKSPVLALFGGDDHAVPAEQAVAFEEHLTKAGIEHEVVLYPGQPHGFFESDHFGEEGHAWAAADAWTKVTRFVNR